MARFSPELTAADGKPLGLQAENEMLRAEIRVAREAAEITTRLVVEQFEKTEAILTRFQIAEERLKFALDGANDGVWDWNFQTGEVFFSKRWKELFGYAEADIGSSTAEWFGRVHPDDMDFVGATIEDHLFSKGPPPSLEYRIRCKDGNWKWTLGRGMVVNRDGADKPLRLVGTNSDIDERKRIEAELVRAKEIAEARREQVASLLDHSGQGFLSFGSDLVVEAECSRACEDMLGLAPAGHDAAEVLFGADLAKASLLREAVSTALAESDPWQCELMLSLLPAEFQLGESLLKAEYQPIENKRVMVVLTDVTVERRLEQKVENEHRRLEMIVAAVTDSRDFFDTVQSLREFISEGLPTLLGSAGTPPLVARELYRQVHTFKGLLNQFSFLETPLGLHALESRLEALRRLGPDVKVRQLADVVLAAPLTALLEADLAVLRGVLGAEFLEVGERITISRDQAVLLKQMALQLLRGAPIETTLAARPTLLLELSRLQKISLKGALASFERLIKQTATRVDKEVETLEIDGGSDVWIEPRTWQPFLRSLTHIFRNAVVHGIESPSQRLASNKPEAGRISCRIEQDAHGVQLSIADDGAGIDVQALCQAAVGNGHIAIADVAGVAQEKILDLIFLDNMSTQQEATELAGRGVGLAVVRGEVRKLGGDVVVRSTSGQGTQFMFFLPLQCDIFNA